MNASTAPLMDPSWWAGHALAGMGLAPSATWCWFNARRWLPEVDLSPMSVPTADAALLLRQAALLLEATHRGGAARRWLSAADMLWARRIGLALLGSTQMPRLSMSDAVRFFDESQQAALRLALPRESTGHAPADIDATFQRRMHKLMAVCKQYANACDAAVASTGLSS